MNCQRTIKESRLRTVLWVGVVSLATLGIVSALARAVSVGSGGLSYEQIQLLMPAELLQESFDFDRWFAAHPVASMLHVVLGGLFLAFAPLQFSSRLRNRYLNLHRWSGRVLVMVALPIGMSGLMLGVIFPYGGPAAAAAVFAAGAFFLIALVLAVFAIRRNDVASHRKWMIRMFAVGLGIATVRIIGLILVLLTRSSFQDSAGTAFWLGWLLTLAVAEWWIIRTRARQAILVVSAARAAATQAELVRQEPTWTHPGKRI